MNRFFPTSHRLDRWNMRNNGFYVLFLSSSRSGDRWIGLKLMNPWNLPRSDGTDRSDRTDESDGTDESRGSTPIGRNWLIRGICPTRTETMNPGKSTPIGRNRFIGRNWLIGLNRWILRGRLYPVRGISPISRNYESDWTDEFDGPSCFF